MTEDDEKRGSAAPEAAAEVVAFPQARVRTGGSAPFRDLGSSKLAATLGSLKEQASGHWCSSCKGIWFGTLLETECPVCGNRNG
jgi:rubrerythrin